MSGDISIQVQNNLWAAIGQDLVQQQMSKNVVSQAYRAAFNTLTAKGKKALAAGTNVHTGFLRASAGKKVDRFPDQLGVYGLVGYLRPNYNKHQFWYILGTKKRTTKSGANRGAMKKASPDPFIAVKAAVSDAESLTVKRIDTISKAAVNKMNAKYGNAWRTL